MTVSQADAYADWKAPTQDGQILIWPTPAELEQEVVRNSQLLRQTQVQIQNLPLPVLRQRQREELGHHQAEQPLIAGGHQTELYHAGVWAKDVLATVLSERCGGRAWHFAVETDQPKHLNLRWPGVSLPIADDPMLTTAEWSGQIAAPSAQHLDRLGVELDALGQQWQFEPVLKSALAALGAAPGRAGLSVNLTRLQHLIDQQLGLRHQVTMIGQLCGGVPYLAFVYHLLARAGAFAADYNSALAEYRSQAGITSATRPMPDLQQSADEVEAPFWLDELSSGNRQRAAVRRHGQHWALAAGAEHFLFDPAADGWRAAEQLGQWLQSHHLRLSPRALTLTTFLRLLAVDLFIHGIGGGRYDQVTDRLIARHFGLQPPRFAVTTGTLLFPGAVGRQRVCLSCLSQEGHRLRHNLLGEAKREYVSTIASLPRRSLQRSMAFHNLHAALSAAAMGNGRLADWENRYREAEQRDRQDEVIFDRELFYALQPAERLEGMIAAYRAAMQ